MLEKETGSTMLAGLIGWPIGHSMSPAMHNAAAAHLNMDFVYKAISVHPADLVKVLKELPAAGIRGLNVTIPHKQAVMPFLDEIDPAAKAIGAVNTIVVEGGTGSATACLTGYNTDWSGFMADLAALNLNIHGKECLVLGAGGSARAITYGLAMASNRVHLFARRQEQAWNVAAELSRHCPDGTIVAHGLEALHERGELIKTISLIVNCTPVGLSPQVSASPWPDGLNFPSKAFVYDLVYNPAETRFMRQAKAAGCRVSNGLGMLVRQGAQAFTLWTGREPNLEVMLQAIQ